MKVSVRVQYDQDNKFVWSDWETCKKDIWLGGEFNYTTANYASITNTNWFIRTGDNFYLTYLNPSEDSCKIEVFINGETSPAISKDVEGSGLSFTIAKTSSDWNLLYKLFKTPRIKTDNELPYNNMDLKIKIINTAKGSNTKYTREYDATITLDGNVLSAFVNKFNIKPARVFISKKGNIKSAVTWVFKNGKWRRGIMS